MRKLECPSHVIFIGFSRSSHCPDLNTPEGEVILDWTRAIDGYCERTDPSYWSEPVNAVTNAAFLIAAWIMWRRVRGQDLPLATLMVVILAAIGAGSYLFHTYAQVWAATADVIPIVLFILLYVFAATRDFLGMGTSISLGVTVLFVPYAAALTGLFALLPFFAVSAPYWPVPLLITVYALLLAFRHPATARGLWIGAFLLILSLVFRSIDEAVCGTVPFGTHFMWHILNGVMLGWMIEVYRRHMRPKGLVLSRRVE
jgi:hypothetical protein